MQTSKYGSSVLITSPSMTSRRFCSGFPCTRFVTSAAMRGSSSTAITFFAFSRIFTVRFPVPGPTSSTILDQISRVAPPWEDLTQDKYIALLQVGFIDNCLSYSGVLQHVLPYISIHLEYIVRSLRFPCDLSVRAVSRRVIALFGLNFGHNSGL